MKKKKNRKKRQIKVPAYTFAGATGSLNDLLGVGSQLQSTINAQKAQNLQAKTMIAAETGDSTGAQAYNNAMKQQFDQNVADINANMPAAPAAAAEAETPEMPEKAPKGGGIAGVAGKVEGIAGGIGGAIDLIGSLTQESTATTDSEVAMQSVADVGKGVAAGVNIGKNFGPWGAVIGGAAGAIVGAIGKKGRKASMTSFTDYDEGTLNTGLRALGGGNKRLKRERKRIKVNAYDNRDAIRGTGELQKEWAEDAGQLDTNTFAVGGQTNSLAYVDDGELLRTPDGTIAKVPERGNPTDSNLVNIPDGTRILSDKLKVPGTNKTFAQMGEKMIKYRRSKGKDIFAQNANKLNQMNEEQTYNQLFALQEAVKAQKGIRPKTKQMIPAAAGGLETGGYNGKRYRREKLKYELWPDGTYGYINPDGSLTPMDDVAPQNSPAYRYVQDKEVPYGVNSKGEHFEIPKQRSNFTGAYWYYNVGDTVSNRNIGTAVIDSPNHYRPVGPVFKEDYTITGTPYTPAEFALEDIFKPHDWSDYAKIEEAKRMKRQQATQQTPVGNGVTSRKNTILVGDTRYNLGDTFEYKGKTYRVTGTNSAVPVTSTAKPTPATTQTPVAQTSAAKPAAAPVAETRNKPFVPADLSVPNYDLSEGLGDRVVDAIYNPNRKWGPDVQWGYGGNNQWWHIPTGGKTVEQPAAAPVPVSKASRPDQLNGPLTVNQAAPIVPEAAENARPEVSAIPALYDEPAMPIVPTTQANSVGTMRADMTGGANLPKGEKSKQKKPRTKGNGISLNLDGWADVLGYMSTLPGIISDLNTKPEHFDAVYNPYSSTIRDVMAGRRYDIDAAMAEGRRNRATSNYNANAFNTNTGANLAYRLQSARNYDNYVAKLRDTKNNVENQYKAEYANAMNDLGRQWVNATNLAVDQNARSRAAARNIQRQGLSEIGELGQTIAKHYNQKKRDKEMLPLYMEFLKSGFNSGTLSALAENLPKQYKRVKTKK